MAIKNKSMKNLILTICILLFSTEIKSQPVNKWDSLAIESQKATDLKFAKQIEELQLVNSIREGNEAIYKSQLYLIEGFKDIRHDALVSFRFGYARYMKIQIKKQQEVLLSLPIGSYY